MKRLLCSALLLITIAFLHTSVFALNPQEIAVAHNQRPPIGSASTGVAHYYIQARGIPSTNLIPLNTADTESITASMYINDIATPISNYLSQHPNIKVIVLCYGIPFRISGTPYGSVDSALMLLGNFPLKTASLHAILQS